MRKMREMVATMLGLGFSLGKVMAKKGVVTARLGLV